MNNLYSWVFDQELEFNQQILSTQTGDYTYRDIHEGVKEYVHILESLGDLKKKRVALIVPSVYHFITLVLTISKLGGIIVPLSPLLRKEDLVAVLDFVDPHIVFTETANNGFQLYETVNNWAVSSNKETIIFDHEGDFKWEKMHLIGEIRTLEECDIQIIGCTTGSTGMPKGVVFDVDFFKRVDGGLYAGLNLVQNDKLFFIGPASAVIGLAFLLSSLKSQYHLVITENFNFPEIIQLFERQPSQKLLTTPSLFKAFDLFCNSLGKTLPDQLSLLCVVGEMVSQVFIQTYASLPAQIMSFLGITELGTVMYTETDIRDGITWTLVPNLNYKLGSVSNEGIGELLYKSEAPFLGYYKRDDLTQEVYKNGWFYSGDLARVTQNGKIEIVGRKKDMIKKGGQQVIPGEIEKFLGAHPDVQKTVVVGIPHPIFGEQIVAFVQKKLQVQEKELFDFLNNKVARYKIPDKILFIDDIPMIQGKVDKVALRQIASNECNI